MKNTYHRRLLIPAYAAILLLALPWAAFALDTNKLITQYDHDVWQTEDGLPQNSIQAITQTSDGYLWFATQEGLARFDGVRFTVFDRESTGGLKNNFVEALLEDREGSLWIGTNGGLSRLKDGLLTTYTTENGLSNNKVRALYEDQAGSLWIGTDGGLNRLRDGKLRAYTTQNGLSNDTVFALCGDRDDTLWIGTSSGLNRFKDDEFTHYTTREGLSHDLIRALYADRDGNLWIGTHGGGLNKFKHNRFTRYTMREGLSSNLVRSIHQDRAGNLWIGTDGGGANRFANERFTPFTTKDGLPNDMVLSIYEDREGNLWFGTHSGGLSRLKDSKVTTYTTQDGLSHDLVRAIYEDADASVWIGTDGGGLNRLQNGRLTVFTTREGLSNNMVRSIFQDREGSLWVGTNGGGVNRFKDGQFTHFTTNNGLSNDLVRSIHQDQEGSLWIGTYGGGLNRFKDGKFTVYTGKDGLSNNTVFSIYEDRAGSLWISTLGGLNRFKDGKFTAYTTKDGLSGDIVFSVYEDSDGSLWVGTSDGLNRLKDGRFTNYTTKQGLFDNVVYRILEDDLGNLWMSCNKGIFSVSRRQLNDFAEGKTGSITSTAYGTADGMKSSECNGASQPAGWRTKDGRLWFPTIKGAVIIDPSRLKINELPPPVKVEQVIVDDRAIEPRGAVELAPGSEKLEFQYTALSFIAPEKVRFKYKLEGFDHAWVDAGTRRTAYYTNIPPGTYQFRVMASNNDGVWNEAGASVDFYLKPRLHQTYWFYLLCALAVVLFGVGIFRLRIRHLKRRENALVQLIEDRTQQLQEINQTLEEQAHQLAQANEQLRRLSYLDALTGVANRRRFDETIYQEWRRAARANHPLSLIMIDIDFFKAFNDIYGHQRGDECLKKVADALNDALDRAGDAVARYGGEEFALLLPNTDGDGLAAIADKLQASVEQLRIGHAGSSCGKIITISMGGATLLPSDDRSPAELIAAADQALYRAKHEGRNRLIIAGSVELGNSAQASIDSQLIVSRAVC